MASRQAPSTAATSSMSPRETPTRWPIWAPWARWPDLGGAGVDLHPVAEGTERDVFLEHYELQPIDRQTNGPQIFYGLRYHTHIVKPGETETFHDQVGYWLWEPATGR